MLPWVGWLTRIERPPSLPVCRRKYPLLFLDVLARLSVFPRFREPRQLGGLPHANLRLPPRRGREISRGLLALLFLAFSGIFCPSNCECYKTARQTYHAGAGERESFSGLPPWHAWGDARGKVETPGLPPRCLFLRSLSFSKFSRVRYNSLSPPSPPI